MSLNQVANGLGSGCKQVGNFNLTQPNPLNKWVRRVDPFILNGLKISTQHATIELGLVLGWVNLLGHFLRALF